MDVSRFIRTGDFCEIVTDKFTDIGVKRGQHVYVAGHKALPISEEDPYTQRIKFLVHTMEGDIVKVKDLYLMDANSLLKVDEGKQEYLLACNANSAS